MNNRIRRSAESFLPGIVLGFFLIIYLVFPTGFSSTDAWNYAAEIRHNGDLLYPYHLLYNVLGYLFCYFPSGWGLDTLHCLKIMNALLAVLSLWVVQLILRSFKLNSILLALVTVLAGSSFSLMRYATENETYIVPLFTGLLSLFYYRKFLSSDKSKYVLLAGFFASAAGLFHMTYIFWWFSILICLMLGKKRKGVFLFMLVTMIIPASYLLAVLHITNAIRPEDIAGFVLNDFRANSHLGISGKGLLLSAVSLIRSFIQVHGYMLNMVKTNVFYLVPGAVSLLFFVLSFFSLPELNRETNNFRFIKLIILIIILQFIFAVLSFGNAEFMVMIPVLVFILFALIMKSPERFMLRLAIGLLAWNLFYGLIPGMLNSPAAADFLCLESLKNEESVIVAADDQLLISMIYYKTGNNAVTNIYKSPAVLNINSRSSEELVRIIDSALSGGENVYTDCTGSNPVSRATILEGDINKEFFSNYETEIVFSQEAATGRKIVSRITGRK